MSDETSGNTLDSIKSAVNKEDCKALFSSLLPRLKSAVIPLALFCAAIFIPGVVGSILFAIFAAALFFLTVIELEGLLNPGLNKLQRYILLGVAEAFIVGAFLANIWPKVGGPISSALPGLQILALASLFFIPYNQTPTAERVQKYLLSIGAIFLVVYSLSHLVVFYYISPKLLFFLIAVVKLSDVGAYFTGSLLAKRPGGNHHLAPTISPKKSFEGLFGGIIFGAAAAAILKLIFRDNLPFGWINAIVLGVLLPIIGLAGDLLESFLKRAADKKDSGFIPGLGGVLDIVDSLILVGAFMALYGSFFF